MRKVLLTAMVVSSVVLVTGHPSGARAQMSPGMMGGGQPPAQDKEVPQIAKQGHMDKKESPKEEPLPPLASFETHGYFRVRGDYFRRLDLGLHPHPSAAPPFFSPLWDYASICSSDSPPARCRNHTVTSSNLRLRLRPTLHVNEYVDINSTMDVLDNLVLGSTPEGLTPTGTTPWVAYPGLLTEQRPYDTMWGWDSLRVKHVWGKITFSHFDLVVGRMPDHWGLGIVANSGMGEDDDVGSTVDRLMLKTYIPNYDLVIGVAWDFASQGYTTQYIYPYYLQGEYQPRDVEDQDDGTRWVVDVQYGKEKKKPLRMGLRFSYMRQHYSVKDGAAVAPTTDVVSNSLADTLQRRYTTIVSPDLWFRWSKGRLTLEGEGVLRYGWVRYYEDVPSMVKTGEDMNILQYGGVLRLSYDHSKELGFGVEAGFASGDDNYENVDYKGCTHFTCLPGLPVNGWDDTNTLLLFHPSYHVDHILFRELLGTVYNAGYLKAGFYYGEKEWTVRTWGVASFAPEPVATPGNDRWYGYEIDNSIRYSFTEKGVSLFLDTGIFFPQGAFRRPSSIYGSMAAEPSFAFTMQSRIVVSF